MFATPARLRLWGIACLGLLLAGCYPRDPNAPEESHPLIQQAVARKATSPREAVRLLEKALEGNPHLALAHWELGLLCLNTTSNYAASVYHFQKVLELRPDWPQASTARQLISNAKLELVKEGVEAPTIPTVQRQMDRLVEELHRLTELRTNLLARVQQLTTVTQQLAAENLELRQRLLARDLPVPPSGTTPTPGATSPTNVARATPRPSSVQTTPSGARSAPAPAANSTPRSAYGPGLPSGPRPSAPLTGRPSGTGLIRSYTVQRGETAFAIARRYGLTLRDLVEANPGLDPGRLRAGQRINLPAR